MSEWLVVAQAIGFIGMGLGVYSFQPKLRKTILRFQVASNLFWVIHFSLLGAMTGAALNAVGGFRAYTFNRFASGQKKPRELLLAVIGLIIIASFITWQGPISLLPMFGMSVASIAFWQRNEQVIRLLLLGASPLWLIYNIISGSYPGIATELFVIISLLVALYRHRNQNLVRPTVQKTS